MVKKLTFIALLSLSTSGCGGTAYLLQPKEPASWYTYLPLWSKPQENSPIPSSGTLAVFYDRSERVLYEDNQEDGSVWVNSTFNVKNTGSSSISISARAIHLLIEKFSAAPPTGGTPPVLEDKKIPVVLDSKEDDLEVEAKSYQSLACRFFIPKEVAEKLGNGKLPLALVIPVRGKEDVQLRLPLWLWRVK